MSSDQSSSEDVNRLSTLTLNASRTEDAEASGVDKTDTMSQGIGSNCDPVSSSDDVDDAKDNTVISNDSTHTKVEGHVNAVSDLRKTHRSGSNIIFGEIEILAFPPKSNFLVDKENFSYPAMLRDFYFAVDEGSEEDIERVVCQYNLDVNIIFSGTFEFVKRKHRGWTAIHIAASRSDVKAVRYLLSEGSDAESVTPEGETPLHIAAKHGAADIIAVLLEGNIYLRDRQNNQGATALLKAIFNSQQAFKGNYRRCVSLLLGAGCNPNISSPSKVTALHVAVDKGDSTLVSKLLDAGANVNALCDHNTSPLCRALISKVVNTEIVGRLLAAGADPSLKMNGRSMLHIAVSRCDDRVIESFLKNGADLNCQDQAGKTPLWVAVEENNIKVVPILAHGGADINYTRQPQCVSLLSHAIMINSYKMVKLLLQLGASTRTETFMWSTPLHLAVDQQNLDIIIELLRANCLLNSTSNAKYALRPMTPIQLAMELGNVEIVCLLMQAGCKVRHAWLREDRLSVALASKPDAVIHITRYVSNVQPLAHLTRLSIREFVGDKFNDVMEELINKAIIPHKIYDYLALKDILD